MHWVVEDNRVMIESRFGVSCSGVEIPLPMFLRVQFSLRHNLRRKFSGVLDCSRFASG